MDLSQLLSRLGRSLDKWNDWAETESNTHTVARNLTLITCGNEVWEEVKNFTCSESSFASPRSGARLIVLAGQNGSTYPVEWKSKRQAATATSSGDAEAIECSSAVKSWNTKC